MAYYEMERLASIEGKDPKPYCAEALRTQLNELKHQGVKTVKIMGYGMRSDLVVTSVSRFMAKSMI